MVEPTVKLGTPDGEVALQPKHPEDHMVEPTIKLGNPDGGVTTTIRGPTARSILLDASRHPALDPSLRLYAVERESQVATPDITLPLPAGTQIITRAQ